MNHKLLFVLVISLTAWCAARGMADEAAATPDAPAKAAPPYTQTQNIVYAEVDGVGLVLDIFAPTGTANGLGLVDVASGAWHSDRGKIEDHRRARVYDIFCAKGYCVFAVRPGSISKFSLAEMAKNLKQGVGWVKDHAGEYKIDPARLGLMGASAGGHLASLHSVTADSETAVRATGVFFPPTDFLDFRARIDANADLAKIDDRIKQFASAGGKPAASTSELIERLTAISPALLVTDKAPPFLIIHGDADPVVPLAQSEKLLAALKAADVPAELIVKKGGGHPWLTIHEEVQVMADWFDKQLAK
jgi:acetyl esterase/lipase